MTEPTYPVKEIRDRAAMADSGFCPDCGAPLTRCDGSMLHPRGAGMPAWKCTAPGCAYVCVN
jgi:hypothetical protein